MAITPEEVIPTLTLNWLTKLYFKHRKGVKTDLKTNDILRTRFEKAGIVETFERDAALLRAHSDAIAAILSTLIEAGFEDPIVRLLAPIAQESLS